MSLRQGVTVMEESKMKKMVKAGATWPEVLAELEDVDPEYVKEHLYDPMVAAYEAELDNMVGSKVPDAKKP